MPKSYALFPYFLKHNPYSCLRITIYMLYINTALYREYHSLKSKSHVGESTKDFETDSKNSVFGFHLNKEKSSTVKKSLFCSTNNKTLSWTKHHGWTTFQSIPSDSKGPKSEHSKMNEVCIYTLYFIFLLIYIIYHIMQCL